MPPVRCFQFDCFHNVPPRPYPPYGHLSPCMGQGLKFYMITGIEENIFNFISPISFGGDVASRQRGRKSILLHILLQYFRNIKLAVLCLVVFNYRRHCSSRGKTRTIQCVEICRLITLLFVSYHCPSGLVLHEI